MNQPLVREIPSNIVDANDFVNKINNFKVPENSFLVTFNVKALYANIPNNYTKYNVATKVITTFFFFFTHFFFFFCSYFDTISFLTQIFTFKTKAVPWGKCAPQHTQTYSCSISKGDTSML